MVESLRDVIAKLKAQNAPKPEVPPLPRVESPKRDVVEEIEEEERTDDEIYGTEEKKAPKQDEEQDKLSETIKSLHDNGVYRLELLSSLAEINKTLTVIAGVLLELSGKGR